jgi:ribosomal protein S18 acetylase RimI-like enzyme
MIQVSVASIRDLEVVRMMDAKTSEFASAVDELKPYLTTTSKVAYLARVYNKFVGSMRVTFDTQVEVAVIDSIGVHPDFRRQGVGRLLVTKVWAEAKMDNFKRVHITVPSYQVEGPKDSQWFIKPWLFEMGFEAVWTLNEHFYSYGKSYDGYVFELELA